MSDSRRLFFKGAGKKQKHTHTQVTQAGRVCVCVCVCVCGRDVWGDGAAVCVCRRDSPLSFTPPSVRSLPPSLLLTPLWGVCVAGRKTLSLTLSLGLPLLVLLLRRHGRPP